MDDIDENIEEYNPNNNILIILDDVIANMLSNNKT